MKNLIIIFSILICFVNISYLELAAQVLDFNNYGSKNIISGEYSKFKYLNKKIEEYHQTAFDTLRDYFYRSSSFELYSYNDQFGDRVYATGSNNIYYMIGSKFIYSQEAKLVGALVAFGKKKIQRQGDSNEVWVYNLDPNTGSPIGNVKARGSFKPINVDTNSSSMILSYVPFSKTAIMAANFAVYIQTRVGYADDNFLAIYSNKQGDALGQNTACILTFDQNNKLIALDLSNTVLGIKLDNNEYPDLDVMIFPVMDFATDCNEPLKVDGFTITGISPNPATDFVSIKFEKIINFNKVTFVEIFLVGINGKVIESRKYNSSEISEEAINFDISSLPVGDYFILFKTNNQKFAGKFIKN